MATRYHTKAVILKTKKLLILKTGWSHTSVESIKKQTGGQFHHKRDGIMGATNDTQLQIRKHPNT